VNVSTRLFFRTAIRVYNAARDIVLGSISYVGEVATLFWRVMRYLFRGANVADQMSRIGVYSMPIALLTILFSGMVFSLYVSNTMVSRGLGNYVGGIVAIVMVRELAPVLAAIVVAARAGSAMAAELGSMKVTEQIDALRAMATSPEQYLVVSRFIACVTMLPIIALFGMYTGIIGGYLVALTEGVSKTAYFSSIPVFITFSDVIDSLSKTVVFGAIIALVACHQGLSTEGGATGVGSSTTRSVVLCIIFLYAADFLIVRLQTLGGG
jgi:phospholipid/cholesterol/gamma-HCH transport system permease protein